MARLTGKTAHIFSGDPALDRSDPAKLAADLAAFHKTGERNGLPIKPGATPVVWQLIGLGGKAYAYFTLTRGAQPGLGPRAPGEQLSFLDQREAIRRGLVSVEGAIDGDGRPLKLDFEETAAGKSLNDSSLDEIFGLWGRGGPRLFKELADRIVLELTEPNP